MEKQDNNDKTIFGNAENAPAKSAISESKKKMTSRRIVALVGVVLLALLYITTLIIAIVDNSDSGRWFMGCIFATIAAPMLIWIYTWLYGKVTGRHTIADAPQNPMGDIDTEMSAQANSVPSDSE